MSSSVALYRKYRGRNLSEIVGQEHITKPLANAIKAGNISHAYLFTGPHGVGKTSVARILAHEINKLEYGENTEHLDIIEIDAASNRRIDEIRDLREKVHIAPSSSEYKVYIIDEVHMLTREAFNALLKTLEEPPKHVVFILATTEAHKLPDTIISRTQRHTFRPITTQDAVSHLKTIAKKEHVTITDGALELLAQHGKGSFRDSISLLDQIARSTQDTKIDEKAIESMLGLAPAELIDTLLSACKSGNSKLLLNIIDSTHELGISAPIIAQQIMSYLRSSQRMGIEVGPSDLTFIDELLHVSTSPKPDIKLETVLLRYTLTHSAQATSETQREPEVQPVNIKPKKAVKPKTDTKPSPKSIIASKPSVSEDLATLDTAQWDTFMETIRVSNNKALHAVLRMARPSIEKDSIVHLHFRFEFHKKQAETQKNSAVIADTLSEILSRKITVQYDIDEAPAKTGQAHSVLEAFGGGEVL